MKYYTDLCYALSGVATKIQIGDVFTVSVDWPHQALNVFRPATNSWLSLVVVGSDTDDMGAIASLIALKRTIKASEVHKKKFEILGVKEAYQIE